jgi:hypothetical protein
MHNYVFSFRHHPGFSLRSLQRCTLRKDQLTACHVDPPKRVYTHLICFSCFAHMLSHFENFQLSPTLMQWTCRIVELERIGLN